MKTKYGTLIKSDNALLAEAESRYPITEATKRLRDELVQREIKATLQQCRRALEEYGYDGEWHHVSRYANKVNYYDVSAVLEMLDEPNSRKVLETFLAKPSRKLTTEAKTVHVLISWKTWHGSRNYRKSSEHEWGGTAQVKGSWIYFDGRRKKMSGNWIDVRHISKAEAEEYVRIRKVAELQEQIDAEYRRKGLKPKDRERFKSIQQSVADLGSDSLASLWKMRKDRNRREDRNRTVNRQLREAVGLSTDDAEYAAKLGWAWQFVSEFVNR